MAMNARGMRGTARLLERFGIIKYCPDGWGACKRYFDGKQPHVGKENTQKIESKHLNLRTRIKRLIRLTLTRGLAPGTGARVWRESAEP